MILNDEEIIDLCRTQGMLRPFVENKRQIGHLSYGVGHFGYDIRISGTVKRFRKVQTLFGAEPLQIDPCNLNTNLEDPDVIQYEEEVLQPVQDSGGVILRPGDFLLAFSLEYFHIPDNIEAEVKDKSTLARMGVAVQNTVLEPGWSGVLTLEISNHGGLNIVLTEGMPIAQVVFQRGNAPKNAYNGRYQDQRRGTTAINHRW